MDRISALPEPLLHHILSFLPFEEVVQTSVLSKRWKEAWDAHPIFEFTDVCYNVNRKKETLKYMEKTLLKRHMQGVSIKKLTFRMELSNYPELAEFIDRSVCYALGCNVQELKLEIVYWGVKWWYKLPQWVLCAKSIHVLDLVGCKLELGGSNVELTSLRKLSLKQVSAGDRVIESLVAGCPLIEYLKIDECVGFKSLELFTLCCLSKIKICDDSVLERVHISALNVHSITIVGPSTCQINIASCKKLKRLRLYTLTITSGQLCNQISELPLLEYLSIIDCNEIERINISSPNLTRLMIFRCLNLVEVNIYTPNLSTFKYMGNILSFSSNALDLSETDLYFYSASIDTDWYIAYIELLAKFHQFSKVLNLQSYIGENAIIPTEVREIFQPPLTGVSHLNFMIYEEDMDFAIADLLDGLLWIAPHAEALSIEYKNDYCDKFSFKVSYKNELVFEEGRPLCCQSFPISCWQDCIKQVEIEHVIKRKNKVKRYSFKHGDILEKMNNVHRYKSIESA